MFFKSDEHKQRFLAVIQQIGKIYDGKLDQEYGAALYILTADADTWEQASNYVNRSGIDFETMLKRVHFSGGYSVLMRLAGNLFNNRMPCNAVELMRLDEDNFTVALTALQVRRSSLHRDDFK
jgi:hypothetical protein